MTPARIFRSVVLAAIASTSFLALASPAHATTYCVNVTPSCAEAYPATAVGVQSALTAAANHPGADTVQIGPGTYATTSGLTVSDSAPLEIVGAGADQTVLKLTGNSTTLTASLASSASRIHDLTFELAGQSSGVYAALQLVGGGAADHIRTVTDAGDVQATGLLLGNGSSLSSSTLDLRAGGDWGILDYNLGTFTATDVTFLSSPANNGAVGAQAYGTSAGVSGTISRSTFSGGGFDAAGATDGGRLDITDSLIDLGNAADSYGLALVSSSSTANVAHLDRDTVSGTGSGQFGLVVRPQLMTGATFTAAADSTVIDLTGSGSVAEACATQVFGTGTITMTYSAYRFPSSDPNGSCAAPASNTNIDLGTSGPGFVNHLGDFHPAATSPLVDHGDPAFAGPYADLSGAVRPQAGTGGGAARIDIGAYEYVVPAPVVPISAPAPVPAAPAPTPAPVATEQPPTLALTGKPRTTLVRGLVVLTSGVTVACPRAAACPATLTLTTKVRTVVKHKVHIRVLTLGTARVSIAAHGKVVIVIRLSKVGTVWLASHRRLSAQLGIRVAGAKPVTLTRALTITAPVKLRA